MEKDNELLDEIADSIKEAQALWSKLRTMQQNVEVEIRHLRNDLESEIDEKRQLEADSEALQGEADRAWEILEAAGDEFRALLDDFERGMWSMAEVRSKIAEIADRDRYR